MHVDDYVCINEFSVIQVYFHCVGTSSEVLGSNTEQNNV